MIAVDTNVLVYAHREDSSWHEAALARLEELAAGPAAWAIPWPCIHEFLAIVTHARIYDPPTPLELALEQVAAWLESPSVVLPVGGVRRLLGPAASGPGRRARERRAGPRRAGGRPLPAPRDRGAVERGPGLQPLSRAEDAQPAAGRLAGRSDELAGIKQSDNMIT